MSIYKYRYFKKVKAHYIMWIFCGIALFAGIVNLQSANMVKDYIPVTGYIENVEQTSVLRRSGRETRYNYTITWERDGEEYHRRLTGQIDKPDETIREIWVSPDNTNAIPNNSDNIAKSGKMDLIVAAIIFVLSFVVRAVYYSMYPQKNIKNMSKAAQKDKYEDIHIYTIMIGVCCAFGALLTGAIVLSGSVKEDGLALILSEMSIGCIIAAIGCFIAARIYKKKHNL